MIQFLILLSVLGGTTYGKAPVEVDAYLGTLRREHPAFAARLAQVVQDGIGTPYSDGPLGEGSTGIYDTDPRIDLSRVDCVTFVEQSVALAQGKTFNDAETKLQQIRYVDGKITFATRNHFMVAEWIPNNTWCRDISTSLGVKTQSLTRNISKADFFKRVKAPDLGTGIPDHKVTIHYVPTDLAQEAESKLHAPTLIVFIGKIDWLFALHCGIYLPNTTGGGMLYHASSKAGKVVSVDLSDYVAGQATRYLGFTAYRIDPPAFSGSEK